jgi:hypothetical protein
MLLSEEIEVFTEENASEKDYKFTLVRYMISLEPMRDVFNNPFGSFSNLALVKRVDKYKTK